NHSICQPGCTGQIGQRSGNCLDTLGNQDGGVIGFYPCRKEGLSASQFWLLEHNRYLRNGRLCVTLERRRVAEQVDEYEENLADDNPTSGAKANAELSAGINAFTVVLKKCDSSDKRQVINIF